MEIYKGYQAPNLMHNLKFYMKQAIELNGFPMILEAIDRSLQELEVNDEDYLKDPELLKIILSNEKKSIIDPYSKEIGLKISQVATKKYGLKLVKNRCACPLHGGINKTSLSFDDERNTFFCFSCGEKGDLFTFIKKMEEINGNKKTS